MLYCRNCGSEVEETATVCPVCGATLLDSSQNEVDVTATEEIDNNETYCCGNCGAEVGATDAVCPNCGANLAAVPQDNAQNVSTSGYGSYDQSGAEYQMDEEAKLAFAGEILKWGILGMVFAVVFPILGIFFSKRALNKADDYAAMYGQRTGKATIGHHLGKAGFIYGIIETISIVLLIVFYVFYFLLIFALASGEF